jgi:hypothetical protein
VSENQNFYADYFGFLLPVLLPVMTDLVAFFKYIRFLTYGKEQPRVVQTN